MSDLSEASTLQQVSTHGAGHHPTLQAISAYLARPEVQTALRDHEAARTYPADVLDDLFEMGVGQILSGEAPAHTYHHSFALLERLGAASGSLGITLGVNVLALGTVSMGAEAGLREQLAQAVGSGQQCSLVLTEWDLGSDLRGIQTQAEPGVLNAAGGFEPLTDGEAPTHYRVRGTKDLINGGRVNHWLVTLVRVVGGGITLLAIPRDETVTVSQRWTTLPAPAADISSIAFRDTVVSADHVVGSIGGGMRLIMHRMARARAGISALAAGTTHEAARLTEEYLHTRHLHGRPLWAYPALVAHMHRLEAIDLAVACLSAKTALLMSLPTFEPAYLSAVTKLACCQWAERAVDEGRRVFSARALVEEAPMTRLVRDVLLYPVFDGTPHVILSHLTKYVRQLTAPTGPTQRDWIRQAVQATPIHWREAPLPSLARPTVPGLSAHLQWLSGHAGASQPLTVALGSLAQQLEEVLASVVADGRYSDQTVAFAAAQAVSDLEMAAALVGLGHVPCRAALGVPPMRVTAAHHALLVDTGGALLGFAAAQRLLVLQPAAADALAPILRTLAEVKNAAQQAVLTTYPRR